MLYIVIQSKNTLENNKQLMQEHFFHVIIIENLHI